MLAARLYAPGDIRVEEVPVPEVGEREVLIKVMAAGICGSDPPRAMSTGTYSYPLTIGHEFAGEIAATGSGVKGLSPGERVTAIPLIPCGSCGYCRAGQYNLCDQYDYIGSRTDGAFAQYMKTRAENVLVIPDSVDFETAATSDPAAVALHAVRKAGITVGDTVAVLGVGPIGLFAVQWAKLVGAIMVMAVDIYDEKLEIARRLGADICVNARKDDPVAMVNQITSGKGINRVIETAGVPQTQHQGCLIASKLGSVVFCGISHAGLELSEAAVDRVMRREISVFGSWNSGDVTLPYEDDWKTTLCFMGQGKIVAKPFITHRYPLIDVPKVFDDIWNGHMVHGKVLFLPHAGGET
ncbi:MAG TPA: galactitol-1-phosphate 5-dehydrogenase [Firmicutes bacterium]|nr:galactitol-1-phosphate 5-dehydrogenase [Bacillota bacterium]